ncbi:MAG: spermidine synthase [Burkholderiaceae bacterium]|nr:spermidine synthase [Burkholderiaceae bacterium]
MRSASRLAWAPVWLVMLASGFAGLGYQIVWTQQAALWLGHEAAAVLAVLAAFFGGLALGAGVLGGRIARSPRPQRWYAVCEALIGLWALALTQLMPPFTQALLAWTGSQPAPAWQWSVAFAGSLLLLLPATAAMGATLPAMAAVVQRLAAPAARHGPRPSIAGLYAANTFGALLGVLAIAFVGVPELGLQRCTLLCAALNLACAALASLGLPGAAAPPSAADAAAGPAAPPAREHHRLALLLVATGVLGIGYEVLVVRVLSQVTEDTVYTFALLLAVYLVGTALGAAALARWQVGRSTGEALSRHLLTALAGACLLGGGSLWWADGLHRTGSAGLAALTGAEGAGALIAALGAEALLALVAFMLPTLVMGALFSHLATRAAAGGLNLGRALALNTLGAALAPVLVGVVMLPSVGPKATLLAIVAAYALLALWARPAGVQPSVGVPPPAWQSLSWWLPVVGLCLLALATPPLAFVDLPPAGRLLDYREGAMAAVSVTEDGQGVRRLRINNRQQEGSSSSLAADGRQALLPLLLHPAPRQVLFLGLGTGLTASAAVQDARLTVSAAELLPEVVAASTLFRADWADPASAQRLHTVVADARRHVRSGLSPVDVIIADNVHPARSGTGSLYTVEHFRAVRAQLARGGLFCQWLPLHQMDASTLASIVAAFRSVWPNGRALLATNSLDTPTLGLLGHADDGLALDVQQVRARLAATADLPQPPAAFGLADEWAVLGSVVAGPQALARLAEGATANTEDRPVVAYRAPRSTYAPLTSPRERLLALLPQLAVAPGELLGPDSAVAEARLAAYRTARDRFLAAGRNVRVVADARQMLAQVGEPLLAALYTSPDFRPAYDPLLNLAVALAREDLTAARVLLARLAELQPARPEALQAMQRLARTSAAEPVTASR